MSDLKVDGIIASTSTNTNLTLQGKGSGKVVIGDGALLFPDADGSDGEFIKTDGSAALSFAADPGGGTSYWVVDAEAQTVTNDQDQADADALASSWERLRTERNALLVSSDWTQGADSPLSDEVKAEWAVYREELRDLPDTTDDPADPTWPEV